jgi:FtsH ternary system domain X7
MARRFRRDRGPARPQTPPQTLPQTPPQTLPPRPPVGSVEEVGQPKPPPGAPGPPGDRAAPGAPAGRAVPADRGAEPPATLTVAGEFRTASAALVFAGGLTDLMDAEFGRCEATGTWWVAASTALAVGRELIIAAGGRVHVEVDGQLVPDRGWGDDAPTGPGRQNRPEVVETDVLELVRAAGLHRHVLPAGQRVTVLAPARRVSAIAQRALDLQVTIETRLVRLDPLFATEPGADTPSMFELRLSAPSEPLPAALLGALDRDACVLVCRPVSDRLLVQHDRVSPLPDGPLAALAENEPGTGAWLLADVGFGSARLTPLTDLRDGGALVRLSDRHRLTDLDGDWARLAPSPVEPQLVPLRLIRARTPDAVVDAVLLDDDDLRCLPALLTGRPLADLATLALGRDRHLMLAPGGVLERLPVGEPLYRLGPGPLFLPLGTRIQPLLPPTARQTLFGTTPDTALVLLPQVIMEFPLARRRPVWTLWAGPPPPVDLQLSREARRALAAVDEQTTPGRDGTPRSVLAQLRERGRGQATPNQPRSWQDEALAAELADDLARAAELCERNGELRRAAHLYERAARQSPRRPIGDAR